MDGCDAVVARLSRRSLGLAFVDPQGFEVKFKLFERFFPRQVRFHGSAAALVRLGHEVVGLVSQAGSAALEGGPAAFHTQVPPASTRAW